MKILVTGGTGFTGYNLIKKLAQKDEVEIRTIARSEEKAEKLRKFKNVEVLIGDLKDKDLIYRSTKNIDKVFHIAALFREAKHPDSEYWKVNVDATKNLLEASLKNSVKRFIHCSTIGVLGDVKEIPANEKTPYNPGDIYQITKTEGEKLALKYHEDYGLNVTVIRPCAIYGPGDMRLYKIFKNIKKRRFIIVGRGDIYYHPVYIDNLIQGFILASENKNAIGEIFIIGDEKYYTLNDFLKIIADEVGAPPPKIKIPAKPVQLLSTVVEKTFVALKKEPPIYRRRVDFFTKSRAFDISKAKKILGYKPMIDFPTGVHLTAEWYRENKLL